MSPQRLLSRSFSADGRSNNVRTCNRPAGERSDGCSYLQTVRPENRSTLYSVLTQLTELTQPLFETILKSRAVSETSNVKFSCVVSGYPAPEVTWYKDDLQLDKYCSLPKYEIIHEGKTHTLHIYNCSVEDAAIYQVSARNSQGIVSCSGVLEVGAMGEYQIHQNFFAKLKQKAKSKSRQEETRRPEKDDVPEVTEVVRASSSERAPRKRRSPPDPSIPQPATAPSGQPDKLRNHKETAGAANRLDSYAPEPSTTSVNAVSFDHTFSNREKSNVGQAIVAHDMVNVVNFTSNGIPGKELFAKKKIKISAERGERGREDRRVDGEHERKKETQRGKDRSLSKANVSPSPSEEQMEVDNNVNHPKSTRSAIKEEKTEARKNGFSEKKIEMALPTTVKSATKLPAPRKQPTVKVSTATKTETTTRPIDLKKSLKAKRENSLSAESSGAPSQLPNVTPQSRAVKQLLTNKDQMDVEETGPSRPGDPLSSAGDTGQAGSRASFVRSEYIEAPLGVTEELALCESVVRPQTGGRITLNTDTSGSNVSVPYTTDMAAKDHMPVDMETAVCDNSPPYHRETYTELKLQPSNEVTDDNLGKPSSYKHIRNHNLRENTAQHPTGLNKRITHPGTERRRKGHEMSLQGENTAPRHGSHPQQQGQDTSAMISSQADAKEKDWEPGNQMTEDKSTTPAADALRKSQQQEVDVSVTENGNKETAYVNAKPETEDTFGNTKRQIPNIYAAYQVSVTESQLQHAPNTLNSNALQIQTQESAVYSSASAKAANIHECKSISESTIPAEDENENRAPGKSSREYDETLLVENDSAKPGGEACFPPTSPAPADKTPHPQAPSFSKLSLHLEKVIPAIYVTDMDSVQENDGTDTTTYASPDFKNKRAESSLGNVSITTDEQTNSIFNHKGEMFKHTDTGLTESAGLTAKTLPGMVSVPLNLKPLDVSGSYQPLEESLKVNESLTVLSPQSADTAGSGPIADNNMPRFAEDSTMTKLTGAGETTNITSLVMQKFTRLNLVGDSPASSQQSNPLLTEQHLPQSPPGTDLKKTAMNVEDVGNTALVLQNTEPKPPGNLQPDTLTVPQKPAPETNLSPQAKGQESNVQTAGDTETKDNLPSRESLSRLPAPTQLEKRLISQDVTLTLPSHNQESVQDSVHRAESADTQIPLKGPQVIHKIRPEIRDASGNIKLWCQFFNVLSDSILRWYKDDVEIAEMKRSAGDESQVFLALVQTSNRDCGLYRCTITNEYGTGFTEYLLTSESPSSPVLREDSPEVGEEIEMTPFLFGKGLSDAGYWGNKFFGCILTEEAEVGAGCQHKTSRAKAVYGLDPVFDSGSSCLIKVQSPIAYSGREEINLAERNIQMTKQACKIQNLAREYCKIFAAQTRLIENFGSELEILPLYFIYRPASSIPYATVEVELTGVYLRYCGLDQAGSLVVRERSEIAQKCSSFQHWVHQCTSGNLLFTRIEGVDTIMTNIGVSVKSEGYQGFPCRANSVVFEKFQSQHRCNYFCGLLGLRPLKVTEKACAALPKPPGSPQVPPRGHGGLSPQTQRKAWSSQR